MLHVLIGENDARDAWDDHARHGRPISWIVPSVAEEVDEALFVFNRDQFIGSGVIASDPEPATFLGKAAFRADVRELKRFKRPLAVDDVAERIPEWQWPASYTKGRTTPDAEIARKLSPIVAQHVARVGFTVAAADRGKAGQSRRTPTSESAADPKDVKRSGAQLDALIREQTSGVQLGAEGRKYLRTHVVTERKANNRKYLLQLRSQQGPLLCDACGVDLAARYGDEHRNVLELHHRVPLSRGIQRPNEDPMAVEVLRERLRAAATVKKD